MNEAVLMAHLREVARTDSAQAIEIARAGNKRFPDSPDAPERTSILIHALITQDKLSEGRAEAEYMVNHFPDSSWVRDIEGFTGAHRHRNIRVNDAGQLEYYCSALLSSSPRLPKRRVRSASRRPRGRNIRGFELGAVARWNIREF